MDKTCPRCGETKPIESFAKDRHRTSGRSSYCKQCRNTFYNSKSNLTAKTKEPGRYKGRYKGRYTGRYKDTIRQAIQRWHEANPGARQAHKAVERAIENGTLPKAKTQECSECGQQAAHYHHHLGYGTEHQLDVIPLCQSCHRLIHSELA